MALDFSRFFFVSFRRSASIVFDRSAMSLASVLFFSFSAFPPIHRRDFLSLFSSPFMVTRFLPSFFWLLLFHFFLRPLLLLLFLFLFFYWVSLVPFVRRDGLRVAGLRHDGDAAVETGNSVNSPAVFVLFFFFIHFFSVSFRVFDFVLFFFHVRLTESRT